MSEGRTGAEGVFTVRTHDRPGVLAKIASAFHRRGLNIRALSVGRTRVPEVSEMLIHVEAPRADLERVAAAMRNLVDVLSVDLSD